jgi:hypothetical protein
MQEGEALLSGSDNLSDYIDTSYVVLWSKYHPVKKFRLCAASAIPFLLMVVQRAFFE